MKKTITLLLIVISSLFLLAGCIEKQDGKYKALAQCLTEKDVKMYGAFWCSHCAAQKKKFGSDFQYATYIECDPRGENADPEACKAAGVDAYPTWIFPGQDKSVGETPLTTLAEKANCVDALPESDKAALEESATIGASSSAESPSTEAPATEAPTTEAPATEAPATETTS